MMSISNNSDLPDPNVSLQKSNNVPPDLPSTDKYGDLLPQLLSEPNSCEAAAGISWLMKAASMIKQNFLLWLGISLTFLFIVGILGNIPVIGFIFSLMGLIFVGGIMKGCAAQAQGEELRFDHLFSGFKTHLQPLIILCLLYIVGIVIALIPLFLAFGSLFLSILFDNSMSNINNFSIAAILVGLLLSLLLIIPLMMIIWFAPPLIVLHDLDAISAMKKSFQGFYSRFNLKTIQCYWDEFFAASVPLANSTQEKIIPVARCYTRLSFIVN
ncbi:BPSS1780 family membrane protein [Psychrobacter sp. LV10R520-6]|uniref:BPSS1780 family membrane protein n=1 Tax=Psychrobacter sp. LV10R520-6 TaxID=1415574 RepID=UPI002AA0D831|nr:BPSS1780 family membrane protein [Psychrobacter sp. LV10R520-6]